MPSDALKKAIKRYLETEQGQEAQRQAQKRYAASEKGKEALKRASENFEAKNADARREYKRIKQAEYRAKRKQKLAESSSQASEIASPDIKDGSSPDEKPLN